MWHLCAGFSLAGEVAHTLPCDIRRLSSQPDLLAGSLILGQLHTFTHPRLLGSASLLLFPPLTLFALPRQPSLLCAPPEVSLAPHLGLPFGLGLAFCLTVGLTPSLPFLRTASSLPRCGLSR